MALRGVKLDGRKLEELNQAFLIYDQDRDQKVTRLQAVDIIRSIGFCPTEDDLVKMLGENEKLFSCDELHKIISTKAPPPETEESLREAFRTFDRDGAGYVDAKEIRHVLVHLGEKLSDEEVDEMIRESEISGGNQINYDELKASFKKFDKANKGYVDAKEVGPLMKAAKQIDSDKDIDTVIQHAGVENDDRVDFDLFVKMVLGHTRAADPEIEMRDAFRVFDVNNDGVINAEELRTVFLAMGTRLTDTEVADLVKEADLDGNGLVDYNEFIRLLVDPGEEKF